MTNFGAFVEMEEGIDGLIHISDLSWTRKIKHPSEVLKKGEEIDVVVLDVNKNERRVSLGFKQLTDDPWPAFEDAYKVDTKTTGKVIRFVDKGLIVELPLGLEGFVPLSQMIETSMAKVTQAYKAGDESDFIVIEFDRTNKRVVLSKKKIIESEEMKKGEAEKVDVETFLKKQDSAPTLADVTGDLTNADQKEGLETKTEEAKVEDEGAPSLKKDEEEKTEEKKEEAEKEETVKKEELKAEETSGEAVKVNEIEEPSVDEKNEKQDEAKQDETSSEQ